jgi:hypothetical protein
MDHGVALMTMVKTLQGNIFEMNQDHKISKA